MKSRLSLRSRIAGAMLALVTVTAILVAMLARFTIQRLEEDANYDLLAEELTNFEQRLRANPAVEPLRSATLHIYRSSDLSEMPRDIARLKPGIYRSVRRSGRSWRVLVRDSDFGRLYVTYDVTDLESAQRIALSVLIAGVCATLALTTWAAFRLSRQLVDPIHRLADRLSNIDPRERHLQLAHEFVGDELEPIARSFDSFLARVDGFVEREQAFTASASHELRTPLAVIQGAVELLIAQQGGTPHAPLARIERAVREMSEFTAALLNLAREPDAHAPSDAACDVNELLPRLIEDQVVVAPQKKIQYESDGQPVRVMAHDSMVAMVVGNLLRNALQHGAGAVVRCQLKDRILSVANEGEIAAANLPLIYDARYTTGGHGMGLFLVRRICDRYGWKIEIRSNSGGTTASVQF
jgi:signal transduction histidine kinase